MDWSKDNSWKQKSKDRKKVYKKALEQIEERKLIKMLPDLHASAFSKIECLECGNCCKNHSPTFKTTDVKRISKYLRIKETEFNEKYLKVDEDNDLVLQSSPCVFLNKDNTCQIYEVRPSDCARFPYTDEDVFAKRKALSLANSVVCPAVHDILEKISVIA